METSVIQGGKQIKIATIKKKRRVMATRINISPYDLYASQFYVNALLNTKVIYIEKLFTTLTIGHWQVAKSFKAMKMIITENQGSSSH